MPNAINGRAIIGKKPCINNDITRCSSTENELLIYSYRGYKNNSSKQPCLSLSDHSTAVLQQIGGVLPMFSDGHLIFVLLRHHVVKQMSKQYCLYIVYDALLRVNCKKNSFRQSRTAGWQRNVLGLFCMDIIAHIKRYAYLLFC